MRTHHGANRTRKPPTNRAVPTSTPSAAPTDCRRGPARRGRRRSGRRPAAAQGDPSRPSDVRQLRCTAGARTSDRSSGRRPIEPTAGAPPWPGRAGGSGATGGAAGGGAGPTDGGQRAPPTTGRMRHRPASLGTVPVEIAGREACQTGGEPAPGLQSEIDPGRHGPMTDRVGRPAVQEALGHVAPTGGQLDGLARPLDALGHHLEAEGAARGPRWPRRWPGRPGPSRGARRSSGRS